MRQKFVFICLEKNAQPFVCMEKKHLPQNLITTVTHSGGSIVIWTALLPQEDLQEVIAIF